MTCRSLHSDTGRSARLSSTAFRSNRSNEIPLAQFNPAMPQNVVSGGAMKIEVGHHKVHEIGLAFETHHVFAELQADLTILGAINVTRLKRLHERDCLREPRLEVGKGLLSVVMLRHFDPREPRSGSLGEIGCNLDLANERKHVGRKSVIEQDFCINLAVPSMGFSLV